MNILCKCSILNVLQRTSFTVKRKRWTNQMENFIWNLSLSFPRFKSFYAFIGVFFIQSIFVQKTPSNYALYLIFHAVRVLVVWAAIESFIICLIEVSFMQAITYVFECRWIHNDLCNAISSCSTIHKLFPELKWAGGGYPLWGRNSIEWSSII